MFEQEHNLCVWHCGVMVHKWKIEFEYTTYENIELKSELLEIKFKRFHEVRLYVKYSVFTMAFCSENVIFSNDNWKRLHGLSKKY